MKVRILSLNLCISWHDSRKKRLKAVAEFVKTNQVDLLLLQEGVRSCLLYDSISELAAMLDWPAPSSKSSWGFPFFWESRTGVLTPHPVVYVDWLNCEVPQTELSDWWPMPWRARAVEVNVLVPSAGLVSVTSCHMSSSPSNQNYRQEQFDQLLRWLKQSPETAFQILGGDFNIYDESPCLQTILDNGYVEVGRSAPDFVFVKEFVGMSGSVEVFTDHYVSDHTGVLVELT